VLFIGETFHPPTRDGIALHAHQLAAAWSAAGVAVSVLTRQTAPPTAPRARIDGIDVRRLRPGGLLKGRGWRSVLPLVRFLAQLGALLVLRRRRYDVVVVSGLKVIPLVAVPLARLLGKRCVVRAEAPTDYREPMSEASLHALGPAGRTAGRWLSAAQRRTLSAADAIVALSPEMERDLRASGLHRVRLVPNGIDLTRFRPAEEGEKDRLRRELGLPTGGPLVAFTGRLARAKGVLVLASAWGRATRPPGARLLFLGSAGLSADACGSELARLATADPDILLVGEVSDVAAHLRACDVFAFASFYEGFGLALVEAMACGLPVVTTPVGVAPEVVRDGWNGKLVAPGDEDGLRRALEWLLTRPGEWPRMGERARAAVAERFGGDREAAAWLVLLGGLRGGPGDLALRRLERRPAADGIPSEPRGR
jgi:glycosyltransferase involved in cell wall biosynthesis